MKILVVFCMIFIIPQLSFANSQYAGKYLCNNQQLVKITRDSLAIGNTVFGYSQSFKKPHGIVDAFIKGNETAIISNQPNWKGQYSLNIRKLDNKNEPPYVADCIKVK